MTTYYEMLDLEPTVDNNEIEDAIDDHYHKWRRLVTHHDPKVVNRANEALQTLETIRATLTDPDQRRVYDAAIGVGNPVMGLGDPDAIIAQGGKVATPPASCSQKDTKPQKRVDAWVCPKCQTPNTIGLRFCAECGYQIGAECTRCGELVEAAAKFCSACGVNQKEARYEAEMQRQAEVREQVKQLSAKLNKMREVVSLLETVARTGKKRFSKSRFKELATDYVPEVEPLGFGIKLIELGVFGGISFMILWLYFYRYVNVDPVISGFILGALITALLNQQIQRLRRRKIARKRLPGYRSRVSYLEESINDLQSLLP
jgi:hypothetical protein